MITDDSAPAVPKPKWSYRKRLKQSIQQELLDFDQAAEFLGVSRRFLEKEIKRGRLTHIALSSRVVRISRSELQRYISKAVVA
jgi:excisionase family DNA binding protein